MSRVVIVRCESYEETEVINAVKKGISLLGGPEAFVKPGEKILLKPNILSADPPEKCVTTHPSVFKAVAAEFKRAGARLSYGDSPALHNPVNASQKSGIAAIAEELGVPLADFINGEEVFFPDGIQNKRFTLAKGVLEADGVISISKLKTHGFARMTGSIKNQFGCIPGKLKGEYHVRIPDVMEFSRMLVDLNRLVHPRLYIMDGIYAMEGNGPRGGSPKKMNMLLFSQDPVALDATVCRIIGLKADYVPTIIAGREMGLGVSDFSEIQLLGDPIEEFIDMDFKVKREPVKSIGEGPIVQFVRKALVARPVIDENKCVKCGVCVQMCPVSPKAVDWHDGIKTKPPSYKYGRCIRCYCCQEMCPHSAIFLKTPLLRKIFTMK